MIAFAAFSRLQEDIRLAYLGDGNNVAHSLLFAGAKMGMHVAVATPVGYEPIYERGEALKSHCEGLLKAAEARIEKITLRGGKPVGTEPLDPQ